MPNVNSREAIAVLPEGTLFIPTDQASGWSPNQPTSIFLQAREDSPEYGRHFCLLGAWGYDIFQRRLTRHRELGAYSIAASWYSISQLPPDYKFTIIRYGTNGVLRDAL